MKHFITKKERRRDDVVGGEEPDMKTCVVPATENSIIQKWK